LLYAYKYWPIVAYNKNTHSNISRKNEQAGLYYPIGTIGTVPRAYDIFRAYEGMKKKIN
jgi:hypothetical protein